VDRHLVVGFSSRFRKSSCQEVIERWPEMAKLGEPEISNEEKSEDSSAVSPDHSSLVRPVLPMEKILGLSRERERQLYIDTANKRTLHLND
jgi:hypothetical protein